MRIASIDIGTNTFRILVCELQDRELKRLYVDRVITRLGGGFSREGKITEEAGKRSLRALKNFARIIKRYKVEKIRAVATSVVRESQNGSRFLKKVEEKTGIKTEVISSEEEAKLTVDGVFKSVSVVTEYCVIFDIGGGSTEYVFVKSGKILGLTSTILGVVHLAERYLKTEIPSESDIKKLSNEIKDILSLQLSWLPRVSGSELTLVGTAGTPTTLAAIQLGLTKYNPDLVNGFILNQHMVLSIFRTLIGITPQKRLEIAGLEKGREDVIIPGALIVLKTMNRFSKEDILVSDGGLLEGVAYSLTSGYNY
jgi:exopolyphosphatase/guanosine-5'-triphosphate,3'-diphosphate pyrophosphatase